MRRAAGGGMGRFRLNELVDMQQGGLPMRWKRAAARSQQAPWGHFSVHCCVIAVQCQPSLHGHPISTGAASDSNIKYLGRSGVAAVGGLSIAFLDGTYNAAAFREGGGRGTGCRYFGDLGALLTAFGLAQFHYLVRLSLPAAGGLFWR